MKPEAMGEQTANLDRSTSSHASYYELTKEITRLELVFGQVFRAQNPTAQDL